ncbi:MAG TPA: adenylate/guanylate cyclase domain-containing protein [Usitatibacter sp.]|nr:adenylate/guanylate cyclase domain-containing protein [Usitatibacter sp.]
MKDPVVNETLRQIEKIVADGVGCQVSPSVRAQMQKVLEDALGQITAPKIENQLAREVTILLADLRGFTPICSAYPASTVLALLNRCLARMSEIVYRHHGTIDKFMGDSMLVLFESPGDAAEGVRRALVCAVDMQNAMHELNKVHKRGDYPEMFFGIGINTGRVLSALLGSDLYSEYTVIGDEVNLTSRIESFSLRGQVLISESTYERARSFVSTGEPMDVFVKGRSKVVVLREVLAIPSMGKVVPRQESRRSPRVEVKIPLAFQMVLNDVVVPELLGGLILDIGYHGVLAELAVPIAPLSEVQVSFDLPLVSKKVSSVYGRVVKMLPRADGTYHAGIEFTSTSDEDRAAIQLFVQLLIQGAETT